MILTYSQIRSYLDCNQQARYRHVHQLVQLETSPALHLGSAVHLGLERWHGGTPMPGAISAAIRDLRGEDERALCAAMLRGYARRYPSETWTPVALEYEFRQPFGDHEIAGKCDGVIRMATGEHWLLEHKTASTISGDYLERLWLDTQIAIYCHFVGQQMGIAISGVLYNVIAKSKIRRGSKESAEEFAARLYEWYGQTKAYHREEVSCGREHTTAMLDDLRAVAARWQESVDRGEWPRNTSRCYDWGRPCAYLPLCRSGDREASGPLAESLYERRAPHTELSINKGSVVKARSVF